MKNFELRLTKGEILQFQNSYKTIAVAYITGKDGHENFILIFDNDEVLHFSNFMRLQHKLMRTLQMDFFQQVKATPETVTFINNLRK